MPETAKRQRWQSVLHHGGISLKGLQSIVRTIGTERVSRETLTAANQNAFDRVSVSEDVECVEGPPFR